MGKAKLIIFAFRVYFVENITHVSHVHNETKSIIACLQHLFLVGAVSHVPDTLEDENKTKTGDS